MRSRRSFLHLGLVAAATLSASSVSAAPAYFGSPRGGGTVTARDDAARTFTAAGIRRLCAGPPACSCCPLNVNGRAKRELGPPTTTLTLL